MGERTDRGDQGRVSWRSRRGMLELDLYLVPFAERVYAGLPDADRRAYRELLECHDWEILDWLHDRSAPPPRLEEIVARVRAAGGGQGAASP